MTRDDCLALDAGDALAHLRSQFALPEGLTYLDGNSLGALPAATPARLAEVAQAEWGAQLVSAWNNAGWADLPKRVGEKIARLIGAPENSVRVADSTSVNLYKVLHAALSNAAEGRKTLLMQAGSFPSDGYIAQGLAAQFGLDLQRVEDDALEAAITSDCAVVLLNHVDYRSGRLYDMPRLTALAQQAGALIVWDLAHSAGALPVAVAECGIDYAVGCGYKYLNGGPGAPAFLYVAPKWQAAGLSGNPLCGWFGHAKPFDFVPDYRPAIGVDSFMVGTPPVLSMAALEVGVDITLSADPALLRQKSLALTSLFIRLVQQELAGFEIELVTQPEWPRGSQVSLSHPEAWPLMQALIAQGVVGDFRSPNFLRFGFAPLYNRFVDAWDAVANLKHLLQQEAWRAPEFQAPKAIT